MASLQSVHLCGVGLTTGINIVPSKSSQKCMKVADRRVTFGGLGKHSQMSRHCAISKSTFFRGQSQYFCSRAEQQGALGAAQVVCSAAGASAGQPADEDPYQVLGVNPLEGFDAAKTAYSRKSRDAERRGDQASMDKFERAYDRIMMSQLSNRKKGVTYGSFKVSKDIMYADRRMLFPWKPKWAKAARNDILINAAVSAAMGGWAAVAGIPGAQFKPFQGLICFFVVRLFFKLGEFMPVADEPEEQYEEDEEGGGGGGSKGGSSSQERVQTNTKRLLRSLGLVLGTVLLVSTCQWLAKLAFDALREFVSPEIYTPAILIRGTEMLVTIFTSIGLFIMASYYR